MKEPDTERSATLTPEDGRKSLKGYVLAFAAMGAAFLIRYWLDPVLKDRFPNAAMVIATVLVAWYGGFIPSCLTAALGFLVCDWFFVPPRHSFALTASDTDNHVAGAVSYLFVTTAIILFGRSMHLARQRADASAAEALGHLKQLEQEVVERKRADEEVRRLNRELEERVARRTAELVAANEELESFTYSVSHDLRAPLRHIDGFAQLLEEECGRDLAPDARGFMAKIRQGARNMGRLVDDLLDLSRVGKTEVARQRVALNELVEEALGEIKLESARRQIEWKIGDLAMAECDPGLVKLLYVNLLSNAVKYTRPREQARIEAGRRELDGETAFFVKDNGVGFSMKYAAKLFGVFQRLHRSEEFEGTGVGLATVARIVRKHGGRIWAEAEEDCGAAFFFTLAPRHHKNSPLVNGTAAEPASKSPQNTP